MNTTLNLDGLVGPTHFYGGLAAGNLAASHHQGECSSPKKAALQGLEKMWQLHGLGLPQGVIPPQLRPNLKMLQRLGFNGNPEQMIEQAFKQAPALLEACYSASSMWAANSATVSPSSDTLDRRLHITPANLTSSLHRSLEAEDNHRFFQYCFNQTDYFHCHSPLPSQASFSDEGAANHIRLCDPNGEGFVHLFIYGHKGDGASSTHYPARQSRLACEAIIRRHKLPLDHVLLIQQNPQAIDNGAFHNDVVAVGHNNYLLLHELAFTDQVSVLSSLKKKTRHWQQPLVIEQIEQKSLSLNEAIKSYLFNSQLVSPSPNRILLIAPQESQKSEKTQLIIEHLLSAETPLTEVKYIDLRQSMNNGGGPACLRLAIPITSKELQAVHKGILLSDSLYPKLQQWVRKHYRDRLTREDLADPQLFSEINIAAEELNKLLKLSYLSDR